MWGRYKPYLVGVGLTVLLIVGALASALALSQTHFLVLGIIAGFVALRTKDWMPWPRVVRASSWSLTLCCATLLVTAHFPTWWARETLGDPPATSASIAPGFSAESAASASAAPAVVPPGKGRTGAGSKIPSQLQDAPSARKETRPGAIDQAHENPVLDSTLNKLNSLQVQLKDLKEAVNQTVTIWSLLIAVLTVVLGFVTSWVIGIAKDVKDQVNLLSETTNLQARLATSQRETQRQANLLDINRLLELIPEGGKGPAQRQVLLQLRKALTALQALDSPFDLMEVCERLERCLLQAKCIANHRPGILQDSELRRLRENLITWFMAQHKAALDLPHLRGLEGDKLLVQLAEWVRLLRSL